MSSDLERALAKLRFDEQVLGYSLMTKAGRPFVSFSFPTELFPRVRDSINLYKTDLRLMTIDTDRGLVVLSPVDMNWILTVLYVPELQLGLAIAKTKNVLRLLEGIEKMRIALLCAEKDPLYCHRFILISHHIKNQVKSIKHILRNGEIESNLEAENRLLKLYKLNNLELFRSEEKILEEARVVAATPQTFANAFNKLSQSNKPRFDVVIINEIDKIVRRHGNSRLLIFPYNNLIPYFVHSGAWIVGMTGTIRDSHIFYNQLKDQIEIQHEIVSLITGVSA